jgi:hypothetical protein
MPHSIFTATFAGVGGVPVRKILTLFLAIAALAFTARMQGRAKAADDD